MKANELMIGDWVKLNKDYCKFLQLTAIDETYNSINYFDGDAEGELTLQLTDIEPIPLTPEILEKNDFIEESTNGLHSRYHLLVPAGIEKNIYTVQVTFYKEPICGVSTLFNCWGPYSDGVNDIHLCDLHYVHEMQHIFRLCGIDKSIEL